VIFKLNVIFFNFYRGLWSVKVNFVF